MSRDQPTTKDATNQPFGRPLFGPRQRGQWPAVGGRLKQEIQDFEVVEVPAYEPCGQGPHYYLWVESRDVDGRRLLTLLADHFGLRRSQIGTAGTKDRRAVTRQWISLPAQSLQNDRLPAPGSIGRSVEILQVSRHGNKLRTGHLRGNRFKIILRATKLAGSALEEAARGRLEAIVDQGLPNYYGGQRFGRDRSNLKVGIRWLRGGPAPTGHFLRRMAASAVQSEIFNRLLARRVEEGSWKAVIDGDIFMRRDSGGRFWIEAGQGRETSRRLARREIVVTGPMPGSKGGLARGQARQMERAILAQMGLGEEMFARFGRQARGTRRALTVYPEAIDLARVGERRLKVEFFLPAGSYATVLVRALTGADAPAG